MKTKTPAQLLQHLNHTKKAYDKFYNNLKENHPHITIEYKPVHSKEIVEFTCMYHGKFSKTIMQAKDTSYVCPGCRTVNGNKYRGDRKATGRKISESLKSSTNTKEAKLKALAVGKVSLLKSLPNNVTLISEYNGMHKLATFRCSVHGDFNNIAMWVTNSTHGCKTCSIENRKPLTEEEEQIRIAKVKATKMLRYGTLSPGKELQANRRIASSVAHLSNTLSAEWYDIARITEIYNNGNVDSVALYFSTSRDIVLGHLHRNNVPVRQAIKVSRGESEVFAFVQSFFPDAIQSNRNLLGNKQELDIYIPSKNIAIEYNGVYWHSEKIRGKEYHKQKRFVAKENGIRLIQIWEDDWCLRKDTVTKFLTNVFGFNSNKYHARKCIIKEVSSKETNQFYNDNHMQGSNRFFSCNIGLYYEDVLVSCMSFMKKTETEYELARFANIGVRGGFSKLLKHMIKTKDNIKTITSFADLEIVDSDSNVYTKNGFELAYYLEPDYKYIVGGYRKHKFGFRKSYFASIGMDTENKTESMLAEELGIERVYDTGKIKYVLKI